MVRFGYVGAEIGEKFAGFEHVHAFLQEGIPYILVRMSDGRQGLGLIFPEKHACFSVGPNGVECDTTTPSPYYTSPRRLPAKLVSGEDPIRQTTSRLPQGHVAFGVFRGDENLEPFRPYMARIGAYLRPGVRYALTPATEKGKGLMLQFWGMHGCFVPALGGVQWGKWLESENALHCRPSSYISAVDGKEYYGLSRFDARLGRYIGDLFFDKDFYRKPLPQEGEAPELWHAMRADRLHEMAI